MFSAKIVHLAEFTNMIDPVGQISSQSQASAFRLRFHAAIQAAQDVRRGAADGRRRELKCYFLRDPHRCPGPLPLPPPNLVCPISFNMFRDPVMVVESGHTYDRNEITQHFAHNNTDPKTNLRLRSTRVVTNWGLRAAVEEWLNRHPDVTPDGWDSRELLPVQVEAPVQTAEPGHGDALVLQMWRDMCPELQAIWEVDRPSGAVAWCVTMVEGRVVRLDLSEKSLSQVVPACIGRLTSLEDLNLKNNQLTSVPAEIGRLTSLTWLDLGQNQLTSVPAEIGQLRSLLVLGLNRNQLTSLPVEIGQLTSLDGVEPQPQSADERAGGDRAAHVAEGVVPRRNQLTNLPAEIGQLTSLERLVLTANKLTSLPAEIGQLTSLRELYLDGNQLTSVPAEIGQLTSLERVGPQPQSADERAGGDWAAHLAGGVGLYNNQLTSVPAEIGQLTSLRVLNLGGNQLTSVPAEIGQLTSLKELDLRDNQLTSVPAEIGQLTSLEELNLKNNPLTSLPPEIEGLDILGLWVRI